MPCATHATRVTVRLPNEDAGWCGKVNADGPRETYLNLPKAA